MKKTKKEKLDVLNRISKPEPENTRWKEIAKWNREHAEAFDDFTIIATRILLALKARGMTQKDLAEKLGVTPQALTRIVKGRQNLTLQSIRKIERVMEISLIMIQQRDAPIIQDRVKFVPVEVYYSSQARKVFSGKVDQLGSTNNDNSEATLRNLKIAS